MFEIMGLVVCDFIPSIQETAAVHSQPGLYNNMLRQKQFNNMQNLLSGTSHQENANQSKMEYQTSRCDNITP